MPGANGRPRSGLTNLILLATGLAIICTVASLLFSSSALQAETFTTGYAPAALRGNVAMKAEAEAEAKPPPAKASTGSTVALVKVNDENAITTAGLLSGLAGFVLGGFWLGAGLFAAGSYIAKKENDDGAMALKGISKGGLDLINYVSEANTNFGLTDNIGSALSNAVSKDKSQPNVVDQVSDFLTSEETKNTVGTVLTSATDLASQIVNKAFEVNEEYKITDQIAEKIEETTKKK